MLPGQDQNSQAINPFTDLPFRAKVTSNTTSAGTYLYAWTEQTLDGITGALEDASPARSGTTSSGWAYELNNKQVANDTQVWMRFRGMRAGQPVYDFAAPEGSVVGGTGVTVEDDDSNPTYASITTIRFDQTDGFVITNPAAGIAQLDLASASASQAGVVDTTTQAFAGVKTFNDRVIVVGDYSGVAANWNLYVNRGLIVYKEDSTHDGILKIEASSGAGEGTVTVQTAGGSSTQTGMTWSTSNASVYFQYDNSGVGSSTSKLQFGNAYIDVSTGAFRYTGTPAAPASAGATGVAGEIRWDASYIYVCTATDTWVRAALATW